MIKKNKINKILVLILTLFSLTYLYANPKSLREFLEGTSQSVQISTQAEKQDNDETDDIERIFPEGELRDLAYIIPNYAYNRAVVFLFFLNFGYELDNKSSLFRSEGYAYFPDQEEYIRKYGILSKRLTAKILDIEPERLVNDCNLNYERMGDIYKKAYLKIDEEPRILYFALMELYEELFQTIKKSPKKDPMKSLCSLHVGQCMWESYLISTGDRRTALKYSGKTYKFTPKPGAFPMTFDTKIHCGETKNAVLLWISPDEYFIERVR